MPGFVPAFSLATRVNQMAEKFHYIVRGLCISEGQILVAKAIGEKNTFLPGGHVDTGEKAQDALVREIKEELGVTATISFFLGAVENYWEQNSVSHFEINLVFMVKIDELSVNTKPTSQEDHLEFLWVRPEELPALNLLPTPNIELVNGLHQYKPAFWASTL
jgi:8-oxo-dGTP diphosphatase